MDFSLSQCLVEDDCQLEETYPETESDKEAEPVSAGNEKEPSKSDPKLKNKKSKTTSQILLEEERKRLKRKEEREEYDRIEILCNDGFLTHQNIYKLFSSGRKDLKNKDEDEVAEILLKESDVKVTVVYIELRNTRHKNYKRTRLRLIEFLDKVNERGKELSVKFDPFISGVNLLDTEDIRAKLEFFTDQTIQDWSDSVSSIALSQIYTSKLIKEKSFKDSRLKGSSSWEIFKFISQILLTPPSKIQDELIQLKLDEMSSVKEPSSGVKSKEKLLNGIYFQIILRFELASCFTETGWAELIKDAKKDKDSNESVPLDMVKETNDFVDILVGEGMEGKVLEFLNNGIFYAYLESFLLPKVYDSQGFDVPFFLKDGITNKPKVKRTSNESKLSKTDSEDTNMSSDSTRGSKLDSNMNVKSTFAQSQPLSIQNIQMHNNSMNNVRKPVNSTIFQREKKKILVPLSRPLFHSSSSLSDKSSPTLYRSVSKTRLPSPKKVCRNLQNLFDSESPQNSSFSRARISPSPLNKFQAAHCSSSYNILSPSRPPIYMDRSPIIRGPLLNSNTSQEFFKSPEPIPMRSLAYRTPKSLQKIEGAGDICKKTVEAKRTTCKRKLELDEIDSETEAKRNQQKMPDLSPDIVHFKSSLGIESYNKKSVDKAKVNLSRALDTSISKPRLEPMTPNFKEVELWPETPFKPPPSIGSIEEVAESPERNDDFEIPILDQRQTRSGLRRGISAASFYSGQSDDNSKTWSSSYAKVKADEAREIILKGNSPMIKGS